MPKAENTPEVLWSKVDIRGENECWPWTGYTKDDGYGRTWIKGKGYYAHRVIYDLSCPGTIELSAPKSQDDSGFLRHSCDNPVCCNPYHLLVGNHADNMRDKKERGRAPHYKSDESPRAKLSEDEVREIRFLHGHKLATRKAMAALYDVSMQTIKGAVSGRHYADIV